MLANSFYNHLSHPSSFCLILRWGGEGQSGCGKNVAIYSLNVDIIDTRHRTTFYLKWYFRILYVDSEKCRKRLNQTFVDQVEVYFVSHDLMVLVDVLVETSWRFQKEKKALPMVFSHTFVGNLVLIIFSCTKCHVIACIRTNFVFFSDVTQSR